MANIYKKAAERKKIVPGGAEVEDETVVVEPNDDIDEKNSAAAVVESSDNTDSVFIPLDDIGANKKPKKRSSTLYLSESVLDELRKRSKKAGLSSSEYLDEVLRRAFGIKAE